MRYQRYAQSLVNLLIQMVDSTVSYYMPILLSGSFHSPCNAQQYDGRYWVDNGRYQPEQYDL